MEGESLVGGMGEGFFEVVWMRKISAGGGGSPHPPSRGSPVNFYLSKIICERPEVNSEPTRFLMTFMNNGTAFSGLDDMQLPVLRPGSASTRTLTSQKLLDFLRP